ncbi:hypothetical protein C9I56_33465 [Paraburkholderia caribensis]|uniref:Uncharacterized protein n=3 Tax=Paraburkholderia caribensis TaxID=75105 RepID=A0A9Q6WK77_9BURK|nr:hypothetical protein C9I56_33465 [Paraburkholderia caribensis]QLB61622.1 hypothetical protein A9O66_04015 [Paraburkholderia caribensis]
MGRGLLKNTGVQVMATQASARSEQTETTPINLASLPRDEALAQTNGSELERLQKIVGALSVSAWKIHNVLAFMVAALADDDEGQLPIRSTLILMKQDVDALATSLMDADLRARHG